MNEFSERLLTEPGKRKTRWLQPVTLIVAPLAAILFQVYVPRFFPFLAYLELPLLVTLHFALRQRSPIAAVFYGSGIGLVQDSLSHLPLGMYGIVKTLCGYFAASVSKSFEVENPLVTLVLSFFFYFFHQFFYWVLARALLGQTIGFDPRQTLIFGILNAVVALPLFHILDRLREAG